MDPYSNVENTRASIRRIFGYMAVVAEYNRDCLRPFQTLLRAMAIRRFISASNSPGWRLGNPLRKIISLLSYIAEMKAIL